LGHQKTEVKQVWLKDAVDTVKTFSDVKPVENFDTTDIKIKNMKFVISLKFKRNPNLLQKLVSTSPTIIRDISPYDSFWASGNNGGENMMGKILTEFRDFIMNKNPK
jgi:predicted NAD-dependent protein-ADP-ribosyltransferase YbiA (DUF1768 family)